MIKKIAGLGIAVSGLLLASPVFGATETIMTWSGGNTTDMMAWIGQAWTDFSSPILIGLGIGVGFVVIRKVIGLVKGGVR